MDQYRVPSRACRAHLTALVLEQDELVAAFVARILGEDAPHTGTCRAIGVRRGGRLVAGWVYHDFQPHQCYISVASTSPRWASREVIAYLLSVPFREWGFTRISTACRASNRRSIEFQRRLGLMFEGLRPGWYPDGDGLILHGLSRRLWEGGMYEFH
jgi:RimJ/RimL family protein N-acetyltransferase